MLNYRKIFFISVVILLFYYPRHIYAAGNCCYGHEGIYGCDTQNGQLYCKDGTVSNYCSCQNSSSIPTATPIPTVVPTQSEQQVSCPVNASFNEDSQECICESGYVVDNGECISNNDYCWNVYGGNSSYDADTGSCSCSAGYVWNGSDTSCISLTAYCQNSLGSNAYYNNSNNTCSCNQGFAIQNNQCVLEVIQQPTVDDSTSEPVITTLPALPTIAMAISSPSAKPVKKAAIHKNSASKKSLNKNPYKLHLKLSNFVTMPNSSSNNIQHFFLDIWNYIQNIFGAKNSNKSMGSSSSNSQINTSKYQLPSVYQQK